MYDPYVELMKLLREDGELEKLREAREKMSEIFPLTEGMNFNSETNIQDL